MKLYYHKTDGGAEYYCLKSIKQTGRGYCALNEAAGEEGDTSTWILRTDGGEFELNTYRLAEAGITLIIKS